MLVLVALLPVWSLVASASSFEKGFLAYCVAGGFYYVLSELWGYRRRARFWTAIAVLAVMHVAALKAVRVPDNFGKASIDVAIVDGLLVFVVVRRLMRGTSPDA